MTVSSGNVMEVSAGDFTVENQPINTDETHYYLYAIDKAGNCSDGAEVIIYRDGAKPVITAAMITENVRNFD